MLRQPLEDGSVNIARVDGNYRYPAKCQLIAATKPCRCGFYPDRKRCTCTEWQVKSYLDKISKPLLERMDICVETLPLELNEISVYNQKEKNESSEQIRERVKAAQKLQLARFEKEDFFHNAELPPSLLEKYCQMTKEAVDYVSEIFTELEFSARVYHKVIKVARTIADLEGMEKIGKLHIAEAVCYRMIDKKYWGRERNQYAK